jgi:hypothetical protein
LAFIIARNSSTTAATTTTTTEFGGCSGSSQFAVDVDGLDENYVIRHSRSIHDGKTRPRSSG